MSDTNQTAAKTEVAATIAELKENLQGASADFIIGQLEKGATLTQALKAHGAEMAKKNESLTKDRDEAKAKLAEADKKAAAAGRRGSDPLPNAVEDDEDPKGEGGSAGEKFAELVDKKVAAGMSRDKAISAVVKANPKLHQAMLDEANAGRRRA